MDYLWHCIKETCAYVIAIAIALGIVFGSWYLYEEHYKTQQVEESEPIKLHTPAPKGLVL